MKNKEGKVKEILARKNSSAPKFPFLFFPENLRGNFLLQKPTNEIFFFCNGQFEQVAASPSSFVTDHPKPLGDHSGHLKGQDRHWGWKKRGRERVMSLVDFWISSDVKDFFMRREDNTIDYQKTGQFFILLFCIFFLEAEMRSNEMR